MSKYFKLLLVLFSWLCITFYCHAQQENLNKRYKNKPIFIYPFYNGVQMIEIDHISGQKKPEYEDDEGWMSETEARLNAPIMNEFLFRDSNGKIIKAYNTNVNLGKLTEYFSYLKKDKKLPSNHFNIQSHQQVFNTKKLQNISPLLGYYHVISLDTIIVYNDYPYTKWVYLDGLIDTLGHLNVPMVYGHIQWFYGDLLIQNIDGNFGVIDVNNKTLVPPIFWNYENLQIQELKLFHGKSNPMLYNTKSKKATNVFYPSYTSSEHLVEQINKAPIYPSKKNGKIGFINSNLTELTPYIYDRFDTTTLGIDLCQVLRNNKWGFIDKKGKEVIACKYDYATFFNDSGYALVQINGKFFNIDKNEKRTPNNGNTDWEHMHHKRNLDMVLKAKNAQVVRDKFNRYCGIINKNTKQILVPLAYNYFEKEKNEDFIRTNFYINQTHKIGIMDNNLQTLLDCEYEQFGSSHNVYILSKENKMGIFSKSFKPIIPCLYDNIYPYCKNVKYPRQCSILGYYLDENRKIGLADTLGNIIVKPIYQQIHIQSGSHYAKFETKEQKEGFIDIRNGKEVIPAIYPLHSLGVEMNNNRVWFKSNEKIGFLGTDGMIKITAEYDEVKDFIEQVARVRNANKWYFIDSMGNKLNSITYDEIIQQDNINGFKFHGPINYICKKDGLFGLCNSAGVQTVSCQYNNIQQITKFENEKGYFRVTLNDSIGYIDALGKIIMPIKHKNLHGIGDGYVWFMVNQKYGLMHINGRVIMEPTYDMARTFEQSIGAVMKNNEWAIIDTTGKLLSDFIYADIGHWMHQNRCLQVRASKGGMGAINTKGELIVPCVHTILDSENTSADHWHETIFAYPQYGEVYYFDVDENGKLINVQGVREKLGMDD